MKRDSTVSLGCRYGVTSPSVGSYEFCVIGLLDTGNPTIEEAARQERAGDEGAVKGAGL